MAENDYERVRAGRACPGCGEDDIDALAWVDDERVRCESCGEVYEPGGPPDPFTAWQDTPPGDRRARGG
jgi:rubredoxin